MGKHRLEAITSQDWLFTYPSQIHNYRLSVYPQLKWEINESVGFLRRSRIKFFRTQAKNMHHP